MLKSNIVSYIKMREKKTMEEIEKAQRLSEADVYILEIGYQLYLQKRPLDIVLEASKETTLVPVGNDGFTCVNCGMAYQGKTPPEINYCPNCGRKVKQWRRSTRLLQC